MKNSPRVPFSDFTVWMDVMDVMDGMDGMDGMVVGPQIIV